MTQDIFIKFKGIAGESQDPVHKDEIEVLNWNWSLSQTSNMHSGSGGGSGKCTVKDLCFEHYIDKASPNLLQYCLVGKPISEAILTMRKAGGAPLEYIRITLQEIIITQVQPTGVYNMYGPREDVKLSFARVKVDYVLQNALGKSAGTVSTGYDIKRNLLI
ncbi:type VI secretion system tube protein Hcp [Pantoea sp. CCBC3-3-1]|uniref:Hcp family type VI secretion system effector n=1 Tax=Pantoea sp. CCBC3-3-1 TaxID=2490851 RepID=UPI0011BF92BD|nr:type VI secretion system tube protein Hcp [Pantoea sp. CCBC3-3-1]